MSLVYPGVGKSSWEMDWGNHLSIKETPGDADLSSESMLGERNIEETVLGDTVDQHLRFSSYTAILMLSM